MAMTQSNNTLRTITKLTGALLLIAGIISQVPLLALGLGIYVFLQSHLTAEISIPYIIGVFIWYIL